MNQQLNPIAYLSAELKARDLDSRLLLAAYLLNSGFCVIVGSQPSLFANIKSAPRGCFLFKTLNRIQSSAVVTCKEHGHLVAATDEEALARATPAFLPHGIDGDAIANCDVFYAQSDAHKAALKKAFPTAKGEIVVTGNARVDFLSSRAIKLHQDEVKNIKSTYGKYILLNTNFTHTNSIWGDVNAVVKNSVVGGSLDLSDPAQRQYIQEYVEAEQQATEHVVALVNWLLQHMPQYRIVIRPHPAERLDTWKAHFSKSSMVSLVTGANPIPWIMGSVLVVHTNCTTGLEAALIGKPTLNLCPGIDTEWGKRYIMHLANISAKTWKDAAQKIQSFVRAADRKKKTLLPRKSVLEQFFPNHKQSRATSDIAKHMVQLFASNGISATSTNPWLTGRTNWKRHSRSDVARKKFEISEQEMQQRFSALAPLAGLNHRVGMAELDDSVFIFTPTSK